MSSAMEQHGHMVVPYYLRYASEGVEYDFLRGEQSYATIPGDAAGRLLYIFSRITITEGQ